MERAKGTGRRIALEDLTGIRQRVTVRHGKQSHRHGSWAFRDLRTKIEYKAARAGVEVVIVPARGTSTACPKCEPEVLKWDRRNRRSQETFKCRICQYTAPADWNAAGNIRNRADVSQPMVSRDDAGNVALREHDTRPSADASPARNGAVDDDCACSMDEEEQPPFAPAPKDVAEAYWDAAARSIEDPRW